MIAFTYRLSTLAVSPMGSPLPICVSAALRYSALPPNSFMPSSKETLVLVEAFSKIIARLLPRKGSYSLLSCLIRFMNAALSTR